MPVNTDVMSSTGNSSIEILSFQVSFDGDRLLMQQNESGRQFQKVVVATGNDLLQSLIFVLRRTRCALEKHGGLFEIIQHTDTV
jgi:hypothetical protein